jgi:hypothetical protein
MDARKRFNLNLRIPLGFSARNDDQPIAPPVPAISPEGATRRLHCRTAHPRVIAG